MINRIVGFSFLPIFALVSAEMDTSLTISGWIVVLLTLVESKIYEFGDGTVQFFKDAIHLFHYMRAKIARLKNRSHHFLLVVIDQLKSLFNCRRKFGIEHFLNISTVRFMASQVN